MLASSQPAAPRVALVHVQDARVPWNVPAARVVRIISLGEWRATAALDVLAALGPVPETDVAHRVVVVRGAGGRETALLAAGPINVVDVDSGDVLPLPVVFAATAPEIAAIVIARDASLSLLLDPLAIAPPPTLRS